MTEAAPFRSAHPPVKVANYCLNVSSNITPLLDEPLAISKQSRNEVESALCELPVMDPYTKSFGMHSCNGTSTPRTHFFSSVCTNASMSRVVVPY